ncbi:MAG: urease accessory protein UreE [Lachnospiraceae bacterium]|nr:urease accessory protein UreE [Lachnospiraceae bacterium]
MLCEKVIGTLSDPQFQEAETDYVDIEWHEAFSKLHRKTSRSGADVGIRLDNEVLKKGLNQDDVLYFDGTTAIAVNIPPCEAIRAVVRADHPGQIAKLCYEVGNTHTSMFRGEDEFTFYAPFHEALMHKIQHIHGVEAEKVMIRFDFTRSLSSTINNHHH